MAVRFTILVLLTTVVVVVSSAGLLGEQWITLSCFFSIFLFFFLFSSSFLRYWYPNEKGTSDIRGPSNIRPKCSIRDAME